MGQGPLGIYFTSLFLAEHGLSRYQTEQVLLDSIHPIECL